ncbi:PRD domain-containing protein [Natribacillus halophilus]|uniref:PRD domain-containing protein n=1 Tax=Natribacillus halophilus TaxID=549003 RepID=A0A1G8N466_9BACI|nr:PRD domain-containing protein [Natribacillus halophilus]SDI75091.1 PRD domain-containing protein [Natribacillus halophilus]
MVQVQERLQILLEGDVITSKASEMAAEAADRMGDQAPQAQLDMLITHLATALTRMERGEELEPPPEVLFNEVAQSPYLSNAKEEISWLEDRLGKTLPEEEQKFLQIHYVSIFQELGGE